MLKNGFCDDVKMHKSNFEVLMDSEELSTIDLILAGSVFILVALEILSWLFVG